MTELEEFAALLHDTFCDEDHNFSLTCYFYEEESDSLNYPDDNIELWSMPHHQKWKAYAEELQENGITLSQFKLIKSLKEKHKI